MLGGRIGGLAVAVVVDDEAVDLDEPGHLGYAGMMGVDGGDLQPAGCELGPRAGEDMMGGIVRRLPAEIVGDVGNGRLPRSG